MSAAAEAGEAGIDLLRIARAFDFPRPEFWEQVEGRAVGELIEPAEAKQPGGAGHVIPRRTQAEREDEYQDAFDIDGTPLYEGFHRGAEGREGILEDVMRFYAFFDLRLSENQRDYPDHLVTELEFLAFLAMQEANAGAQGKDHRPFQRAQRDFIARHLGIWLPSLKRRVAERCPASSVYSGLAAALHEFVQSRHQWLQKELEGGMS